MPMQKRRKKHQKIREAYQREKANTPLVQATLQLIENRRQRQKQKADEIRTAARVYQHLIDNRKGT